MAYEIGFIGCGNMGGALISAVAKSLDAKSILVYDVNEAKANEYRDSLGVRVGSLDEVAACRMIVLGVKPQGMTALLKEMRPLLAKNEGYTLVSMAAGLSIASLREMLGVNAPIIRIMPNTPASVGEGMILYTALDVSEDAEKAFLNAFDRAGALDRLDERLIDAASALSGCGPAFVALFAESLADGAVCCGLPRDKANLYAAQTLLGTARLLLESGKHPGALKDAVCSPGGTTIEGVRALEEGALRGTVMNAVLAAYEKTLALGKK